jgi:hypothetical protein
MRSPYCLCLPIPIARQWLGKFSHSKKHTLNNRRIAGRDVFYAVCVVSNKYVLKGKFLQGFLVLILFLCLYFLPGTTYYSSLYSFFLFTDVPPADLYIQNMEKLNLASCLALYNPDQKKSITTAQGS